MTDLDPQGTHARVMRLVNNGLGAFLADGWSDDERALAREIIRRDIEIRRQGRDGDRAQLLTHLAECANRDPESGHMAADVGLLAYIDDDEITTAFEQIPKWYA